MDSERGLLRNNRIGCEWSSGSESLISRDIEFVFDVEQDVDFREERLDRGAQNGK